MGKPSPHDGRDQEVVKEILLLPPPHSLAIDKMLEENIDSDYICHKILNVAIQNTVKILFGRSYNKKTMSSKIRVKSAITI